MPKEPTKLRWDERGKLFAAACVCGVLLAAAALLPLAFRTAAPAAEPPDFTMGEKAALFVTYWYNEAVGLRVEKLDTPDDRISAFCEDRMSELSTRCLVDLALTDRTPTGSEYTAVTGEAGTLRLCRMWFQGRGDWQNWLDVCFDADTGDVYYLYVSRECLTNLNLYAYGERPAAEEIAAGVAEAYGGALRYFLPDGNGGGTAVLGVDDETLCYEISRVWYDTLIDIRINCV